MPGLDGLRAIAVLAVIAYHLNLDWVPGGLLGVTMFFVLSGYLITDILLKQLGHTKSIDLKTFFIRRARRLLPAMFSMMALVSIWLLISDSSRLLSLKGDIGSALLYISNWWLIFHEVSYFESFGPPSPFGHLWSLAVEEQFYLVWPLLLLFVIKFVPKRGKLALWTLALAALSAGAMSLLYEPGVDPSRIYYGTDTRAFALLIGAALAVVWPSWKLSESLPSRSRITLDAIGTIGLIVIVLMISSTGEYDSFLYRGGMVLLAIATAAVVGALAHPASKLAQLIGNKVLTWIGVRSYGIYLYHYPIIVLTTPTAEMGELHAVRALIQVVLTFILAELSWRFVEEPIRHGALERLFTLLRRQMNRGIRMPKLQKSAIYFTLFVLVVFCMSFADSEVLQSADKSKSDKATVQTGTSNETISQPQADDQKNIGEADHVSNKAPILQPTTEPTTEPTQQKGNSAESSGHTIEKPDHTLNNDTSSMPDDGAAGEKPAVEQSDADKPSDNGAESSKPEPEQQPSDPLAYDGITAIGDSIILDAVPYLEKLLPGIVVDGKVGRQLSQAATIIEELKKDNKLGNTVIIELGTNGAFTTKQLDALLTAIGSERQIIMVNTRVPRKWQDTVNEMLAETADKTANVTLVDWYTESKGKEDFFSNDGVHLKKHGAEFFADLLAEAVPLS
nr:acyltransferase family protein [Paenibacillus castaneae]